MGENPNPLLKNKGANKPTRLGDVMKSFGDFFYNLIDLRAGLDREGTIVNIKNNKKMAGANVWLLMCSIMIASLGLDLNSPAVIIGAMLISPLMSPILGVGLAVGINDNDALFLALKHFGIAIAIALITSTLYFWLTPFGNETAEIRARTAPTLLDVMVAFFGGVAGIISGSRKDKSNAIPGVAIATALMPPLCVTGYGLANGNWAFMWNSFYLFFLNATFVALATYMIVRFLKFPKKTYLNSKEEFRTRLVLGLFALIMIIPSGRILFNVLHDANQQQIINSYLEENFMDAIFQITPVVGSDSTEIKIFTGQHYDRSTIDSFRLELQSRGAHQFNLNFLQDNSSKADIEELKSGRTQYEKAEIDNKKAQLSQEQRIRQMANHIDSLTNEETLLLNLKKEIQVLFPSIVSYSISKDITNVNLDSTATDNTPLLIINWRKEAKLSTRQKESESEKIMAYIKLRLDLKELKIIETK